MTEIKLPPLPAGYTSQHAFVCILRDYARAAVALNAPPGADVEADMYWDADDPEHGSEDTLHDAVVNVMDNYTRNDLPMMLRFLRARKMHDIEVEVTGYDDEEGWKYQVLPAGPEAAC